MYSWDNKRSTVLPETQLLGHDTDIIRDKQDKGKEITFAAIGAFCADCRYLQLLIKVTNCSKPVAKSACKYYFQRLLCVGRSWVNEILNQKHITVITAGLLVIYIPTWKNTGSFSRKRIQIL